MWNRNVKNYSELFEIMLDNNIHFFNKFSVIYRTCILIFGVNELFSFFSFSLKLIYKIVEFSNWKVFKWKWYQINNNVWRKTDETFLFEIYAETKICGNFIFFSLRDTNLFDKNKEQKKSIKISNSPLK